MSTQIKNTLFRFVTMRAPELSGENLKEARFVFRNKKLHHSVFDKAIEEKTILDKNWPVLQSVAATFSPLSETSLKTSIELEHLELAVYIARNKHFFNTIELLEEVSQITKPLSDSILTLLWDNLFYQIVSQKDFYVKESIMQLLIANHVYKNIDLINKDYERIKMLKAKNSVYETELIKNIVNAKVVLPKELFDQGESTAALASKASFKEGDAEDDQPVMSIATDDMQQFVAISEAKNNIDRHLKLKSELEKIEKNYRKEYQEEYDKATEEYQSQIEPILEEYNQQVETTKAKWCDIKNPSIPFDENDPCNQVPFVPQPKLPKFEFRFKDELDLDYLQPLLTEDSFHALLDVLEIGIEEENPLKDEFLKTIEPAQRTSFTASLDAARLSSFSDVYTLVQNAVNTNSQTIINNTSNQNTTSVAIGGVLFPVVVPKSNTPSDYQICSKKYTKRSGLFLRAYVNFDLTFDLPDSTWQIVDVKTAVTQNTNLIVSSLYNQTRTDDTMKLGGLFSDKMLTYASFLSGISSLAVTITFSNGAIQAFNSKSWNSISCLSGTLTAIKAPTTAPSNPASNPASSGPTNPSHVENNFIPSGFGVKRLGIADYKKVEQTVQGYVEGDVAHIENVMAREYKEKATRRLRRSENTTTTSSESEKEQLSDTTSTDRFEMQNEVAKVLQEGKDFAAGASFSANWGAGAKYSLGTNVNMATHSSKEESNLQAITQAKEVTERAMERIVTKVKEERISKIVEEFEENNKHGFDNTKGDKHVVGVFRWVDKIYKNQVLNFGKRLMFEFMVPEPAKLHLLGMVENKELTTLEKPVDPRKFTDVSGAAIVLNLKDYSKINENTAKYWGGLFNVELDPAPEPVIYTGKSISGDHTGSIANVEYFSVKEEVKVPEGYKTISASVSLNAVDDGDNRSGKGVLVSVGEATFSNTTKASLINSMYYKPINGFVDTVPVSATFANYFTGSASISIKCELTAAAKTKWQQKTFKSIMDAYEEKLQEYNSKIAEENAVGIKIKGENPGFYRQIENIILRKNCISYIIDQNEAAKRTYGKSMFKTLAPGLKRNFANHEINVGATLDDYASFSKFIEQAFEWEIMSYNFYPYYWGAKEDWSSLYQYDNNDPLFRSFMQAGMARVVVTVRPGFEDAVNYYMQTGQIWNGGEVPVIEDKLFMSIIDELRQVPGQKEGKAWATRLPTALTILQADSIGLKVDKALPFDEDLSDFEDPTEVPQSQNFEINDAKLGGDKQQNPDQVASLLKRKIENIDIKNGNLQLTTNSKPRKVVAQISVEAIKREMGL